MSEIARADSDIREKEGEELHLAVINKDEEKVKVVLRRNIVDVNWNNPRNKVLKDNKVKF